MPSKAWRVMSGTSKARRVPGTCLSCLAHAVRPKAARPEWAAQVDSLFPCLEKSYLSPECPTE